MVYGQLSKKKILIKTNSINKDDDNRQPDAK